MFCSAVSTGRPSCSMADWNLFRTVSTRFSPATDSVVLKYSTGVGTETASSSEISGIGLVSC